MRRRSLNTLLSAALVPALATALATSLAAGTTTEPPTATYQVTFDATWTAASHPDSFPPNPHFSPLIGGTHNDQVSFWETGTLASDGIEQMAETGGTFELFQEVTSAISAGTADQVFEDSSGLFDLPNSTDFTFTISRDFPLVTLVTMIAPSPDWFVGVHGLSLAENGSWKESVVVDLDAYDAGTDSGSIYTSPNADTDPAESISLITTSPFDNGVPLGTFTFTRTDAPVSAEYRVDFVSTWSAQTHPTDFPPNPHFSPLIGGTHTSNVVFWESGGIATEGIETMAETGGTGDLTDEVNDAIAAGDADQRLPGSGIGSPGSTSLDFTITKDFPLVTLVTMIAPSPDWFVGVHGLNLLDGDDFRQSVVIELWPYDAGTDSGSNYTSSNQNTSPQDPIAQIVTSPFDNGVPLGTFTFTRTDIQPGPVEFNRGDANADGFMDLSDGVKILGYVFLGGPDFALDCEQSADPDDNGSIQIADGTYVLNYLFLRGASPVAPFGACGPDDTPDDLSCESFDSCP